MNRRVFDRFRERLQRTEAERDAWRTKYDVALIDRACALQDKERTEARLAWAREALLDVRDTLMSAAEDHCAERLTDILAALE